MRGSSHSGQDKNGPLSVTVWLAIKQETERRPFIGKALNKRTIQQLSNYFVPLRRLLSLQCNVTVKLFVVFVKRIYVSQYELSDFEDDADTIIAKV